MAPTINRMMLGGVALVQPAVLRFTSRGTPYCRFVVMVDDSWGERPRSYPLRCILWGERARELAPRLVRDARVTLEGRLSCSDWTDQEGRRHLDPEMAVEALLLPNQTTAISKTTRPLQHRSVPATAAACAAPRPLVPAPPRAVPIAADELPPF